MRPKGAKWGIPLALKARWVPNHHWAHLSHSWPQMAKKALRTTMASHKHQRPPDQLSNPSPQLKGDFSHSSMHPVLKVAGVVHIRYYIPLCTIFAQKFNGDAFRTKFHDSKLRSQNPMPI
ncbi:hypothetical protein O181_005016 [Austropuccinia psidii MF-1]|uniref:Uncharacterized protein n=1 Tax=Austropuccinia psidii MF-1 TaxID=1389203 RepID=A0A9Q3BGK4_9BASI|nr:hypothetical protein [Austropuccinia psidii MF-1]